MTTTRRIATRGVAVATASAVALAFTAIPAQAQEGVSAIDTSVALLETSATLQGGDQNLLNVADLLGSLAVLNEDDLEASQMIDAMIYALDSGVLAVLAGLPGGLNDFAQTCLRAINGEATVDDVWRQFNGIGAPLEPCNTLREAGGYGGISRRVELGRPGPTVFRLRYETYSIPDTVEVYYEGRRIFVDPMASTNGDRWVDIHVPPGGSTSVRVDVIADIRGTEWNFTAHCP